MKARWALGQNVIEPRRPHCGHCGKAAVYGAEITGSSWGYSWGYRWFHRETSSCEGHLQRHQDIRDQFGTSWWALPRRAE